MRSYGRNLLFFVAVSFSWLGMLASGPTSDPVTDNESSTLKSVGYVAGSLALWLALLAGGLWAVSKEGPTVLLVVLLGWGFLVAPVVVLVMKAAFPGISGRLQAQVDEVGRNRQQRR